MKPTFEVSVDTSLLTDCLLNTRPGEQVTYATLGAAIGRAVAGGDPNLQSALRRAQSEEGVVFGNVRGIGYQRLTDPQIVRTGPQEVKKLRRSARRAASRLTNVKDFIALPREDQVQHNTYVSVFGAISSMTRTSSLHKLESRVQEGDGALPLAKTLDVFRGQEPKEDAQ